MNTMNLPSKRLASRIALPAVSILAAASVLLLAGFAPTATPTAHAAAKVPSTIHLLYPPRSQPPAGAPVAEVGPPVLVIAGTRAAADQALACLRVSVTVALAPRLASMSSTQIASAIARIVPGPSSTGVLVSGYSVPVATRIALAVKSVSPRTPVAEMMLPAGMSARSAQMSVVMGVTDLSGQPTKGAPQFSLDANNLFVSGYTATQVEKVVPLLQTIAPTATITTLLK